MNMQNKRGTCASKTNRFCYICGNYIFKGDERSITPRTKKLYYEYFKMKIGDQDKPFAPHKVCKICLSNLSMWEKGKLSKMPFSTPMAWREQRDHNSDCYFCLTKTSKFNKKTAKCIFYPDLPSAIRPVPYEEGEIAPLPSITTLMSVSDEMSDEDQMCNVDEDIAWKFDIHNKTINQTQLDQFIRNLKLSKEDSCLAGSMLRDFGVLARETRTSIYRTRDKIYLDYFKRNNSKDFVYCSDITGLLSKMGINTNVKNDWWLFIDGSVKSIKAVLLHVDKNFPSIPIAYSITAKETYETIKSILEAVRYDVFRWKVCSDLKVIGILTGMQKGFTKYNCFLCLWDSRARHEHYSKDDWTSRSNREPGYNNIQFEPLISHQNVILPPLHIKLGLFKNFVKALDQASESVKILQKIFPKISIAKIKEGVFIGPDTRRLMHSQEFTDSLSAVERRAWDLLTNITENFLGIFIFIYYILKNILN